MRYWPVLTSACDAIAGAEEIGMHEVAVQEETLRSRIADAAAELTRQTLIDVKVDVHEIRRARQPGWY